MLKGSPDCSVQASSSCFCPGLQCLQPHACSWRCPTSHVPHSMSHTACPTSHAARSKHTAAAPTAGFLPSTHCHFACASWQVSSNMDDTCHAHVNSVTRNDMQAKDELEIRSSLRCQMTDLRKAGSWSLLQYLHSSRFCPKISPNSQTSTQRNAAKKHSEQHRHPFPAAALPGAMAVQGLGLRPSCTTTIRFCNFTRLAEILSKAPSLFCFPFPISGLKITILLNTPRAAPPNLS